MLTASALVGCASNRGGTANSETYSTTGQGSSETAPARMGGNDFGRGTDRFDQESSQMLPRRATDDQIYRK
ncbi:MAG TPA: hypothetical protein VMZ27_09485 [Candidatus Saccharimonadales bacterium]|nr:hypothetical protein [Candidatus Saccharimonadales bacterium]